MEGRKGRTVPVNDHYNCEEQSNNFLPGTPWPYFFTLFRITVMRHPAKMQSLRGCFIAVAAKFTGVDALGFNDIVAP